MLPLLLGEPDVNEPATGYLWGNLARHHLTYRNYGEYIQTRWCEDKPSEETLADGERNAHGSSREVRSSRRSSPARISRTIGRRQKPVSVRDSAARGKYS